jgi:galactokinase
VINPPLRFLTAIQQHFNETPPLICPVPGREMWAAALLSGGHQYHVIVPDLDSHSVFDRRSALQKRTVRNRPLPRWARYVAGALLILSDQGVALPGGTLLLLGDEPAGPRYEHALGMASAALYLQQIEGSVNIELLLEIMEQAQKRYLDGIASL